MSAGTRAESLRRQAIGALRLLRLSGHAVRGWLTVVLLFPRMSPAQQGMRVQAWASRLLRILGIALDLQGEVPVKGPVLLVANHVSWLDIVVMHAARHCRFVGKSELRQWPMIGRLTAAGGTLFIERESRRDAMRVLHHMVESLQSGDVLAVFPEGTTGDGRQLLPFHANLVQAAISAQAPVQPVGLSYLHADSGARASEPLYIGDDTFVRSIWRTACAQAMVARVRFGRPQYANGRDRRAWAVQLHTEVGRLSGSDLQKRKL